MKHKQKVIIKPFYGHVIEVIYSDFSTPMTMDGITHSMGLTILSDLEKGLKKGTFRRAKGEFYLKGEYKYVSFTYIWRKIELDYSLMLKIAMWATNRNGDEIFTKDMFITNFGNSYGKHYFMKWKGELECNYWKAYGYFRTHRDHGQIFCDMMMELVEKYEKRENL